MTLALMPLLALLVPPAPADDPPPVPDPKGYVCHEAPGPIEVDGRLDDPGWEGIPWTDLFVIAAHIDGYCDGLRLLSELRSRGKTQAARMILLTDPAGELGHTAEETAAMAADLGADDVMIDGFHAAETALRVRRLAGAGAGGR